MHDELHELLRIIEDIAEGRYSDEIMAYTAHENETVRRIAEAVGMMMVKVEAREHHLQMLVDELTEMGERVKANAVCTVQAMAVALGARDDYTRGHALRVAAYARRLALRVGLDSRQAEEVHVAGMLHDIGKIGFSDKVFANEDTRPDDQLLAEIRRHPDIGARILQGLEFLGPVRDFVHAHHERLDGRGYPQQLHGDQIPHGARILAVADCFDAMTTDRPYQKGKSAGEACAILSRLAGAALDPELVAAFAEEIAAGGLESGPA